MDCGAVNAIQPRDWPRHGDARQGDDGVLGAGQRTAEDAAPVLWPGTITGLGNGCS